MNSQVNIVVVVDVIGALSDGTLLNGNLCMVDDSESLSTGQGTPQLCTVAWPGQTVQWTVLALDLQTPVEIKGITFLGAQESVGGVSGDDATAGEAQAGQDLGLNVWSGTVPPYLPSGVPHRYRMELQMYEGEASVMEIDSCALACP